MSSVESADERPAEIAALAVALLICALSLQALVNLWQNAGALSNPWRWAMSACQFAYAVLGPMTVFLRWRAGVAQGEPSPWRWRDGQRRRMALRPWQGVGLAWALALTCSVGLTLPAWVDSPASALERLQDGWLMTLCVALASAAALRLLGRRIG
jgi:hypothetical protein